MTQALPDLSCRELVELVSDYLSGHLSPADRTRFELHLAYCAPCRTYLEQMRHVLSSAGRLTESSLSPEARQTLLSAFRHWRRGSGGGSP